MEISFDPVSICFQLIRFEVIGEQQMLRLANTYQEFPTNPI